MDDLPLKAPVGVSTDRNNQNVMNKEINLEKRLKVADLIRKAREAKGLSQEQLAEQVDFKGNTIWRIEAGRFSPNADQLYAICEVLKIPLTLNGTEI